MILNPDKHTILKFTLWGKLCHRFLLWYFLFLPQSKDPLSWCFRVLFLFLLKKSLCLTIWAMNLHIICVNSVIFHGVAVCILIIFPSPGMRACTTTLTMTRYLRRRGSSSLKSLLAVWETEECVCHYQPVSECQARGRLLREGDWTCEQLLLPPPSGRALDSGWEKQVSSRARPVSLALLLLWCLHL
jgi:hypothetical protein